MLAASTSHKLDLPVVRDTTTSDPRFLQRVTLVGQDVLLESDFFAALRKWVER